MSYASTRYANDVRFRTRRLIYKAKRQAAKHGLPFDLDKHIDDIQTKIETGCELTGLPFSKKKEYEKRGPHTASIDRKIPELGYVYSNVRVICWALNAAFNAWGEGTTREIFQAWEGK